jgi:alkylglycerol monooxygenase
MDFVMNSSITLPAGPPDEIYYKMESFLAALYLVRPTRTMVENIEDVPNFFNMVITVGPIFFLLEIVVLWLQGKRNYRWNDSLVGMCAFLVGAIPLAFIEAAWFTLYNWIWQHYRIVDLPWNSMWTYLLCMPAMELANYVAHRIGHEFNIFWTSHQLHHTTEEFKLTAGIRFTFLDKFLIGLNTMPMAFLLPPGPAKAHHELNLVYQFWVHTETIGDLGPLESIFYTPAQHRIHHGVNRFCIDTNYGGFLNVWDQFFGTMKWPKDHKGEEIYYGLVDPIKTWDVFYIYAYPFRDMYRRFKKYDNFADKLGVFIKGPGWEPGKPRLGSIEDIPEEPVNKTLYDKQSPLYIYIYCLLHLGFVWHASGIVVNNYWIMPTHMQLLMHAFILWTVIDVGYLLEHKFYAPALEWTRCAMFFVVEIILAEHIYSQFPDMLMTVVRAWCALSVIMWTFNFNSYSPKSKVE